MLSKVRLFRRHNNQCRQNNPKCLKEDVLDKCQCNLGYKGTDPTSRIFRRLMFVPAITEERLAWRALEKIENGQNTSVGAAEPPKRRMLVAEAFESYLDHVRQRNVKESTIYNSFRPVGNAVKKLAELKGIKYLDELGESFGPELMQSFQRLTVNVRSHYRTNFRDFARVAKKNQWTKSDLAERIETPARGKGKTPPVNPTEPFDLKSELPRIMEAIPRLTLQTHRKTRACFWKTHPETAKALVLVLRYTGLRLSDALLFEPRSLEKKTVKDQSGKEHEVYVRWIRKQKKTDAPVFVVIPYEVGEFITRVPRLSEKHAFIPSHLSGRGWGGATSKVIFPALEALSGVRHIHAHRFRDTFAVELYRKTKDMAFVSRALGHASLVVTMNHYSHFLQEDQDEAIKKMLVGWGD